MELLSQFFVTLITTVVNQAPYPAIFMLMALESALIPIPSEITMPFAGYLVSQGKLDFWLVVLVGGIANLAGSLAAYAFGKWADVRIHDIVRKYGKYLLMTVHEVEQSEKWFRKYGEMIAFGSRLLPIVRTFISLPAGMAKMNIKKFSAYTLAGSLLWSVFLTYIGIVLGNNWHSIEDIFRKFQYLIIAVFVLFAVWYLWHKIKKIRVQ